MISSFSFETTGVIDDLFSDQILNIKTKSASISRIVVPKTVKEKLEIEDQEVVQINGVRLLKGRIFTYTINYLPLAIGLKIKEKDLYERRLLQVIEEDLGIQFTGAVQTIKASFANQEVSEKLAIPSGSPILFVEKIVFTKNQRPVELFQSSHRGDLYKFIIRFRNKRKKEGNVWVQPIR